MSQKNKLVLEVDAPPAAIKKKLVLCASSVIASLPLLVSSFATEKLVFKYTRSVISLNVSVIMIPPNSSVSYFQMIGT
jgi:hypothetical protein